QWVEVIVFHIRVTHDDIVFTLKNHRKNAVVRSDEILILRADEKRPTLSADAGINNNDVNGLRWKVRVSGADGESAVEEIVCGDVVRNVDDGHIRINFEDDALHRADDMIGRSV